MALANGVYTLVHNIVSPVTLAIVVAGASLAFLARLEVQEYDRRGTKPTIGTH
jgi:hypothetical protein